MLNKPSFESRFLIKGVPVYNVAQVAHVLALLAY